LPPLTRLPRPPVPEHISTPYRAWLLRTDMGGQRDSFGFEGWGDLMVVHSSISCEVVTLVSRYRPAARRISCSEADAGNRAGRRSPRLPADQDAGKRDFPIGRERTADFDQF
jgi:hypothetical protein